MTGGLHTGPDPQCQAADEAEPDGRCASIASSLRAGLRVCRAHRGAEVAPRRAGCVVVPLFRSRSEVDR